MERKNRHFRQILLFHFYKGKKADEAHKEIMNVRLRTVLKNFVVGIFSLKGHQRSGRLYKIHDDQMKTMIETNSHITV